MGLKLFGIRKTTSAASVVLMTMMLVFPVKLYYVKIVLLVFLLLSLYKEVYISKDVRFLCGALCLSTLWGLFVGAIKGTPNPFANITVGMLWPLLSLFIVLPQLKQREDFNKLLTVLFYIHTFIVFYDVLFALHIIWDFPFYNLYPEVEIGFSYYGTSSRLNLDDNLSVLTFTIPVYFLVWLSKYEINVSRIVQTIVVFVSFFLLILSGRRVLVLVFILTPIMVIFLRRFFPKKTVSTVRVLLIIFVVLIVAIFIYMQANYPEIIEGYTKSFFNAFDEDEESVRFVQSRMLMEHFNESPLCGEGTGAVFYEPGRGYKSQFELSYLLIPATQGFIGFTFYLIGIVGVLFIGYKHLLQSKDPILLLFLYGYGFILLAHATNPILSSFDLMLPLYFCYAKINSLALGFQPNRL